MFLFSGNFDSRASRHVGPLSLRLVSASGYFDVSVSQAKQMIESNPNLVILDVRTQAEYDSGHIQNATLIPLTELASRLGELDKNKEILVYCGSGGRSATASQILADNGFSKVYNMLGGITAWRNAGYWIEIIHKGDLIMNGTQMFVIENCTYIQEGNIIVKDYGSLVAKNAIIHMEMGYWLQYEIHIEDQGFLRIENAEIISNYDEVSLLIRAHSKASIASSRLDVVMSCEESSQANITSSKIIEFRMFFGNSQATLSDLSVQRISLWFDRGSMGNISVKPGLHGYWDLHGSEITENVEFDLTLRNVEVGAWILNFNYKSEWTVYGSTVESVGLDFETPASLKGLEPISCGNLTLGLLTFVNSSINMWQARILDHAIVTVEKSTMGFVVLHQSAEMSAPNSKIQYVFLLDLSGKIHFSNTVIESWFYIRECDVTIDGTTKFQNPEIRAWSSSNVTRNYNILLARNAGGSVENVELALYDRNDTVVWKGLTDSLGKLNFDLTFTDGNYTDTLRLRVLNESFYKSIETVSFLSRTPVVISLTQKPLGDINEDRTVNIVDVTLVARSFGCVPSDERWNELCDLNNDAEVNILDISLVAKDFGKTA